MMFLTTAGLDASFTLAIAALILVLACFNVKWGKRIPKGLRLPPGPRGMPIVGNLADMPKHHEWEKFSRLAEQYGDLIYLNVLGQGIIYVNTMDVSRDLFDKRSSIYSDRPRLPMMSELMGFDWRFGLMGYGQRWRRHRKMFHQYFHSAAVISYHDVQIKHTRDLLRKLHKSPHAFVDHVRHLAGATIMEIVYGINVLPTGDPYIEMAEKGVAAAGEAGKHGSFLVDTFPILKHVPEWMPGAAFKKKARMWRVPITQMAVMPFMAVKKALSDGMAKPSVAASLLQELHDRTDVPADEEETIRNTVASAYGAGSDTTVSALSVFMLAMVIYPKTQRKAQAELDLVIGMGRLPKFEDRRNLPYINALCKEIYRWHAIVPFGNAHRVMQDDIYGDYFIPGGSIVIGNAWNILHDETVYGLETDKFEPDRFLKPGVKDPTVAFGFGRRICPGRYMADNSVFIAVASILKVFDISHVKDEHGNEIPVGPSFTSGFLSRPEPFQCSIKLRSAAAEILVAKDK